MLIDEVSFKRFLKELQLDPDHLYLNQIHEEELTGTQQAIVNAIKLGTLEIIPTLKERKVIKLPTWTKYYG